MGTNEELLASVNDLTGEVHDLSGRLTAKELLHKRTRNLTLLSLGVALIAIVALVMVYSLARSNKDTNAYWSGCLSRWGEASSERAEIIGTASEERDKKQGAKDRAMRILVDYRGDPNNAATDQAKADYRMADDEAIEAERELQFLREQYPPPQIENFCTRMKDTVTDPKAQGD